MKGSGLAPTVFGVECCLCLWGSLLWVLSSCWRVETTGRSFSLQKECLCKEKKPIPLECVDADSEKLGLWIIMLFIKKMFWKCLIVFCNCRQHFGFAELWVLNANVCVCAKCSPMDLKSPTWCLWYLPRT